MIMVIPVGVLQRRRMIRRLIAAGATAPNTAKTPDEAGIRSGAAVLRGLVRSRVVIDMGDGRYFVDTSRIKSRFL